MDYMRALEMAAEHRGSGRWRRWLRLASRCRSCGCSWPCPSRKAADRVLAEAAVVPLPREWRAGQANPGRRHKRP